MCLFGLEVVMMGFCQCRCPQIRFYLQGNTYCFCLFQEKKSVMIYFICGVVILIACLYARGSNSKIFDHKTVMLATAHPDDECMFFGPTITALLNAGSRVHILCLSTGNWYGIGDKRRLEFFKSCEAMGVDSGYCHIIDDPKLPDSPTITWDNAYIISILEEHIKNKNVTALLTFDKYGVSGHHNHISVYEAVSKYSNPVLAKFKLTSINSFRKYSSSIDVATATFFGEQKILTPISAFKKPYLAMFKHKTQLMWFRYLYLMFSRYMFMNTLEVMQ